MENLGDYDFPHGSVLKKFEGTIYHINNMQIRPTRIQNEELHAGGMARRDATFDAENVKTGEPVILKLRSEYFSLLSLFFHQAGRALTLTSHTGPIQQYIVLTQSRRHRT